MPINSNINVHEIVICANMFVKKDGKVLMLRRSPLKKILPNHVHPYGGKVDQSEDPMTAAIRELREEAGLEVENIKLEAVITEVHTNTNNWQIFHFSGDYKGGEVLATEEGEAVMLSAAELEDELLFASVKELIRYILDPKIGPVFARFEYNEAGDKIVNKQINFTSV